MKIEPVKDGEVTLALVIRDEDWVEGLNFVSAETDYVQLGTWGYEKGKKLLAHTHLKAPREAHRTQEVVFVKRGRLRADIYTEKEAFLRSVELKPGDAIVLLAGGHGYEILEDNTKVLEVKNGPYVGAEKDRRRIAEK